MSYLKSDFFLSLKPSNPKPLSLETETPIKSVKPYFSKLKNLKENYLSGSKTPPLILFVNLLMKHGKKNHALRVLSMTLSLFKARITKIKLEKESLKNKSLKAQRHVLGTLGRGLIGYFKSSLSVSDPRQSTFSRNVISNYSIKPQNFTLVLFSKKTFKNNLSQRARPSLLYFPFFKYRKVFPFTPFFYNVFDNFYARKVFFCRKLKNLKQLKNIEKSKISFFYERKKTQGPSNKKYYFLKENRKSRPFGAGYLLINPRAENMGPKILFESLESDFPFQINKNALLCKAKKNTPIVSNHSQFVWYKSLAKKPSWDKLTTPQKNTFLYCLYQAISNVKPPLECRTKRIGGSNKQIPSQVSEQRQWGIAIRWIIEAAQNEFTKKKNKNPENLDFYRPFLNYSLEPSKVIFKQSSLRGKNSNLGPLPTKNKYTFMSSLLQGRKSTGPLKDYYPKTKFYCFSFFLAESLENAYYKRGPAMQKRNLWIETALANRAFLRYRWW